MALLSRRQTYTQTHTNTSITITSLCIFYIVRFTFDTWCNDANLMITWTVWSTKILFTMLLLYALKSTIASIGFYISLIRMLCLMLQIKPLQNVTIILFHVYARILHFHIYLFGSEIWTGSRPALNLVL